PWSFSSSRFTEVTTACLSPISFTERATSFGSCQLSVPGLPVLIAQKLHARVQVSPKIINVAVPLPQHSPIFGHLASSQTVCKDLERIIFFMLAKLSPPGAFTLSHSGLLPRVVFNS